MKKITEAAIHEKDTVDVLLKAPEVVNLTYLIETSIRFVYAWLFVNRYGVLSLLTAFVCVVSENQSDIERQMILDLQDSKKIIPTSISKSNFKEGGEF